MRKLNSKKKVSLFSVLLLQLIKRVTTKFNLSSHKTKENFPLPHFLFSLVAEHHLVCFIVLIILQGEIFQCSPDWNQLFSSEVMSELVAIAADLVEYLMYLSNIPIEFFCDL